MAKISFFIFVVLTLTINVSWADSALKDPLLLLPDQNKHIDLDTFKNLRSSLNALKSPPVVDAIKPIVDFFAITAFFAGVSFSDQKLLKENQKSWNDLFTNNKY